MFNLFASLQDAQLYHVKRSRKALHLYKYLVSLCKHDQTYHHLVSGVGKQKITNGDHNGQLNQLLQQPAMN